MHDSQIKVIIDAIFGLTKAIHCLNDKLSSGCEMPKSHSTFITKQDLIEMEIRITMKIEDLIAAAAALSTASDGVSVKLDALILKVDAAVAALSNADLTPAQEAAVNALKVSAAAAAAEGDKVDAEVAKLDKILPTPAPAAPAA